MGEVRGGRTGDSRDHLHAGLDIRAQVGQSVLAITDEKVVDPLSAWAPGDQSEGLQIDQVTYIHMRVGRTSTGANLDPSRFEMITDQAGRPTTVRVRRGTRFVVGEPLGTVNGMAHVHLELGRSAGGVNPISLHFPGLEDHVPPTIDRIQIYDAKGEELTARQGGRLIVRREAGPFSIVVEAWDQLDGNERHRRLGLYKLGLQVLTSDGAPVPGYEQPQINIEFDRLPLNRSAAKIAYAADSGITFYGAPQTRFRYVISNRVKGGTALVEGWRPAQPSGDYLIRVFAADHAGNAARSGQELQISLR